MKSAEVFPLPEIDDYHIIKFDSFHLIGKSIAGVETVLTVPQWGITFDTGRAPLFAIHHDTLALTHWHMDHAGGLSFYLGLRCLHSLKPLRLVVPHTRVEQTRLFLESLKNISESRISYEVFSAAETHQLGRDLFLLSVPSRHGITSTGYAVKKITRKLAPEFRDQPQSAIVAAKNSGKVIHEEREDILFAFSGDASGEFMLEDAARRARVIVMECSFFGGDDEYEKCRHYGHTHILDWQQHAESLSCEHLVMSHTSMRYSMDEIRAVCAAKLPKAVQDKLIILR